MRLLLIKQDQISQLEKKLHDIDANEEAELYLGSCRLDANSQRAEVLQQLEAAFSVYGLCTPSNVITTQYRATKRQ